MSKSSSRRFPVTVTHLPVTRCQICDRTVAYRPGKISEVLTEDYRRAHPESLGLPSQLPVAEIPHGWRLRRSGFRGPGQLCGRAKPEQADADVASRSMAKTHA
jgi:hypothetical protein